MSKAPWPSPSPKPSGVVTEALEKLQVVDGAEDISASDFQGSACAEPAASIPPDGDADDLEAERPEVTCVAGQAEYTPTTDTSTDGMELVQAMCADASGDNEMPLTIISRLDYMEQPDKTTEDVRR